MVLMKYKLPILTGLNIIIINITIEFWNKIDQTVLDEIEMTNSWIETEKLKYKKLSSKSKGGILNKHRNDVLINTRVWNKNQIEDVM